jgi:hypothetical protein
MSLVVDRDLMIDVVVVVVVIDDTVVCDLKCQWLCVEYW